MPLTPSTSSRNCILSRCAPPFLFVLWSAWLLCAPQSFSAEPATGEALFAQRCKSCHDPAVQRAPTRLELSFRARADIVAALTMGVMQPMATGLTSDDVDAIAAFLAPGPQVGLAGNDAPCASQASPIKAKSSDWPLLGRDEHASRFQPEPELSASDVPRLKLKWAFSMQGGGQPIVIGDWLFMTNRGGKFYALDAKSGCVRWAIADGESRATAVVVRSAVAPSGWLALIGASRTRTVRAFDAQSGEELWHSDVLEEYTAAAITGTPVVSGDTLFVPLSSGEEVVAMQGNYPCCRFRGSVVALDLNTGHRLWQTFTIQEPLHPTHKNASGVMLQGPAGAPVWASPTADTKRGLLYVVTGDSYTDVPTQGTDAILALEMRTGKIRWRNQVTAADNYIQGCFPEASRGPNCPSPVGPDFDFGASPLLVAQPQGHQLLVAGQKSGVVWGLDPDTGRRLWDTRVGAGSALGGVEWGIASDGHNVYVPTSDIGQILNEVWRAFGKPENPQWAMPGRPGLTALDVRGKITWSTPAPHAPCHYAGDRSKDFTQGICVRAQSAAPSAMPGIVFSGTLDGWLRAYNSATGKIVWQYSTTEQTYETVNGVHAQPGGGIDGMGPTIAGGMVYSMSGFNGASQTGSNGVNVLLAFSVEGR
jgi:polyvinyl alcohol dehydrogenase (cytochrome)